MLSPSTPGAKHISSDSSQPGALGVGCSLADFDGNGQIDLILSASGISLPNCSECGLVYIFYDADTLPASFNVSTSALPCTRMVGGDGWRIGDFAVGGDVSNDGRADIAVSAHAGGPNGVLKVAVTYGSATRPDTIHVDTDDQVTIVFGESNDDNFGSALEMSDLNDDGVRDLSVGADFATVGALSAVGKVYSLFGIDTLTGVGNLPNGGIIRAFPNPSLGVITIEYSLSRSSDVKFAVHDVRGRRVYEQQLPSASKGSHLVSWNGVDQDGRQVPSGVYFCRIEARGLTGVQKLVLVR